MSQCGPVEWTRGSWLPPHPFAVAVAGIMALVPGATVLLRSCLCVLLLRLENVPSLQFRNLSRPGCLGEESFFPMDHGGFQGPGREQALPLNVSPENGGERGWAEGEHPALYSVCFSSATAAWRGKVGGSAFASNLLDEERGDAGLEGALRHPPDEILGVRVSERVWVCVSMSCRVQTVSPRG